MQRGIVPEGVDPRSPSPYAVPLARGPAPPGPWHDCPPGLLLSFFRSLFFCKLCPHPGSPAAAAATCPVDSAGAPSPGAFVSAAPRVAPNSALPARRVDAGGGGGSAARAPPLRPRPRPLPPQGPGAGGRGQCGRSGTHGGPWSLGIGGSGTETQVGSRRRRGRGRGVGRRGGERSGRRLPAVPAAAALPPPRPLSAAPLFPESALLPPAPPGACGPGRAWRRGRHRGPPSKAWGLRDSWPRPACSLSRGRFPPPGVGDRPRAPGDGGVQCFRAAERPHRVQRNLGPGKMGHPRSAAPHTHTRTPAPPSLEKGERATPDGN